jgi:hypothetical protein
MVKGLKESDMAFNRIQMELEELFGTKKISRAEADRRLKVIREVKKFMDGVPMPKRKEVK